MEPTELQPSDSPPELPFFDEDWFRFYYYPPNKGDVRYFEVHELCHGLECHFTDRECSFHPHGCECSLGECRRDFDTGRIV